MAVTSVKEVWTGRSGERAAVGSNRQTRTFHAYTDDKLDTAHTVLTSGLVPVPFVSTHPANALLLCRSVMATQKDDSPFVWDVEAEYTDERSDEDEDEIEENPLLRAPKIAWGSAQYQKPVVKDISDEAILNSAGDPFDPPPVIDDARWVVRVTANVANVPAAILSYNNRINSAAITVDGITFAKHTAKVQGISIGERQKENDVSFRQFTYELHYRSETWLLEPLDAGFQYLDAETPPEKHKITITGEDGEDREPTTPQLLDGNGAVLASPSPSTAVYLEFDVYHEADLSVLPGVT